MWLIHGSKAGFFRTGARNIASSRPLAIDSFHGIRGGNPGVFSAGFGDMADINGTPPVPPALTSQKRIHVLGWVGIGCEPILGIAIVVISLK